MEKIKLKVNDIFSQAWKGCQKPMWFKVLNIDRANNSIEVECYFLKLGLQILQKQDLKLVTINQLSNYVLGM